MPQIEFNGTAGDDFLDASGLAAGYWAVMRGRGGADTLIGSNGNDRFSGGDGGDFMDGGAGNDQFFQTVKLSAGGPRDTIIGGSGIDELNLTLNGNQLTDAVRAELAKVAGFLISAPNDPNAHFVSDVFHLDMTQVERMTIRVDGVLRSVDSLVSQITVEGGAGNDLLDGSAHSANLVMRGQGGDDTMLGGSGNDRFDGGAGADSMFGGAGDDQFFIARDNSFGGARDTIDGGTGNDELAITVSSYQMTTALKAELQLLKNYLAAGNFTTHFTSDLLHLDMVNVESARVRLDGVMHSLADLQLTSIQNVNFSTTGTVTLNTSDYTVGPASLDLNTAWVSASDLDSFLGLAVGTLATVGTSPTDGSAAMTTLHLTAGQEVSYDWKFNAGDYNPFDDTGYAIFGTSVTKLSSVSAVGDYGSSGWQTGHFTAAVTGDYAFGFAVTNARDTALNSHLLVDHVLIG